MFEEKRERWILRVCERLVHAFHSAGNVLVLWACGDAMQGVMRKGRADNYSMDSLTLSIKHLSAIWLVCLSVCVCV